MGQPLGPFDKVFLVKPRFPARAEKIKGFDKVFLVNLAVSGPFDKENLVKLADSGPFDKENLVKLADWPI